ncbi:MAG: ATP-binding cassette domain-containing protein [Bdellovibrionales bacterium]
MSEPVINVEKLTRFFDIRDKSAEKSGWFARKVYKKFYALNELDFSIRAGEKVAFIGPNGAGKSTTLKILSGLLQPSLGSARVCGMLPWQNIRDLSRKIGLVFGQKTHLWPNLTVADTFDLLARIYSLEPQAYLAQRDKLIEIFGLGEFLNQYALTLSLGQKMRSDLACALLHQPSVLFLDEPTIGLDVTAKAMLRDHLNKLAKEFEITVLLTSHDTDDIEKICDRVILIDHGKKLLDTTVSALHRDYSKTKTLRLVTEEPDPVLTHPHAPMAEEKEPHCLTLKIDIQRASVQEIVAMCLEQFTIRDMSIEDLPLEEIIKAIYAKRVCLL